MGNHGNRFIIQQNPFNDEFQLVKIFNYINHKNVRSLFHPNKEVEQKKDLTTINCFHKYQTNVKALAEKNIKLIEEIQNTNEKSNNLQENLQSKEKHLHEDVEQEKIKMKEKKLKLKEEIFQLKLQNKENEQKYYDFEKTLGPEQSLIDEQKIRIEKLQLELSHLKYEKDCLKKENENLQKLNKNMHDERSSSLSTCEETIKEKLIKPGKQKEKIGQRREKVSKSE